MLQQMDSFETLTPGFKKNIEPIVKDQKKWESAILEAKREIEKLREKRKLGNILPNKKIK